MAFTRAESAASTASTLRAEWNKSPPASTLSAEWHKSPPYERPEIPCIVHFGANSRFFAAHWAKIVHDVNLETHTPMGIIGVSRSSPPEKTQIDDNIFVLTDRDADHENTELVGSVTKIVSNQQKPGLEKIKDYLAADSTHTVTMTITQNGYYQKDKACETNQYKIDIAHPDVHHDLTSLDQPKTTIGTILYGLRERYAQRKQLADNGKVTVMSLDNLPNNGKILRALMADMAAEQKQINPELVFDGFIKWLESHVLVPTTVVDRIAPEPDDALNDRIRMEQGYHSDANVKVTERVPEGFAQLVVEDLDFPSLFPKADLKKGGVLFEAKMDSYWQRKFLLLNAGHTIVATLAQAFGLGGKTIADAMQDPVLAHTLTQIHSQELMPLIKNQSPEELAKFASDTRTRFLNPALGDQVARVGAEGGRKIPKYVLYSIRQAHSKNDGNFKGLTAVLAAWLLMLAESKAANGTPVMLKDEKNFEKYSLATLGQQVRVAANDPKIESRTEAINGMLKDKAGFFGAVGEDELLRSKVASELADLLPRMLTEDGLKDTLHSL